MMPVGPYDGIGGQHGYPRWVDYHPVFESHQSGHLLQLEPTLPEGMPQLMRSFQLYPSNVRMATHLTTHKEGVRTSIGHHDYYPLENGDYLGLAFNGGSIDDLIGQKGATEAVMNGEARFWPGFGDTGVVNVRFPNEMVLTISALAISYEGSKINNLGMLLWRAPDAPFICLEPTLGVIERQGKLRTDDLLIKPNDHVVLSVTTHLS